MSGRLWMLIGVTAVMTALVKAAGPVALGGRDLPDGFSRVVRLLSPALLAALVVTQTLATDGQLTLRTNAGGVVAAAIMFARGASVIVGVLVATFLTAGLRAIG